MPTVLSCQLNRLLGHIQVCRGISILLLRFLAYHRYLEQRNVPVTPKVIENLFWLDSGEFDEVI